MSNKYTYQKHPQPKPAYASRSATSPNHSRAATYAKSKQQGYRNKQSQHLPSNSIAATSNATLNDIETTRSDMRDILWQVIYTKKEKYTQSLRILDILQKLIRKIAIK